jgi:hypothetical protein
VHPPHDGFHIPHTLYPARKFQPRPAGEREKVKGVPDAEIFLQQGAGSIVQHGPVVGGHGGGDIHEKDQIRRGGIFGES